MVLSSDLQSKLAHLPESPGCYLFKNEHQDIIYIGKAAVLADRVRSYFQKSADHSPKTSLLVDQVADLETSVRGGGEIDASTVMWWLRQSDEARNGICGEGQPLQQVLVAFGTWLAGLAEDVKVWGNGAAFDNVILAQAYRRADLTAPWPHWNDRCYRTMKAMRPDVKIERVGVHYNALSDAESQALHLMAILAANA